MTTTIHICVVCEADYEVEDSWDDLYETCSLACSDRMWEEIEIDRLERMAER